MTTKIITGQDAYVARWMFEVSSSRPMQVNAAIGLADSEGKLVGAIAFTEYNGSNAEVHFVGPNCLTRKVVRLIFGLAVMQFNLNRLTVHTRKRSMARGVTKLGAKFECVCKRLYGPTDKPEHAGRRYVFYRETMIKLAGLDKSASELSRAA